MPCERIFPKSGVSMRFPLIPDFSRRRGCPKLPKKRARYSSCLRSQSNSRCSAYLVRKMPVNRCERGENKNLRRPCHSHIKKATLLTQNLRLFLRSLFGIDKRYETRDATQHNDHLTR